MPFMHISPGPHYVKKGTPKEREQHRFQQLADEIFTDMLPRTCQPRRRKRRRADATNSRQVGAAEVAGVDKLRR